MPSELAIHLTATEVVTLDTVLDVVEMLVIFTSTGQYPGDSASAAGCFEFAGLGNCENRRTFLDVQRKLNDARRIAMKGIAA